MQSSSFPLMFSIPYMLTALSNPTEKVIEPFLFTEISQNFGFQRKIFGDFP